DVLSLPVAKTHTTPLPFLPKFTPSSIAFSAAEIGEPPPQELLLTHEPLSQAAIKPLIIATEFVLPNELKIFTPKSLLSGATPITPRLLFPVAATIPAQDVP